MRTKTLVTLTLAIAGSFTSPANAQIVNIHPPTYCLYCCPAYPCNVTGTPVIVYADPSDVVVGLDQAGGCGSTLYNIRRTNENFKEFTAVALTAFSFGKKLTLFVYGCDGDRNIIDHGAVGN
jgi:hypothetical protein